MSIHGSGASRGGDVLHNEDAFLVEDGLGLYVVCDGASGRPAGERASRIAVAAVEEVVADAGHARTSLLWEGEEGAAVANQSLHRAMRAVLEAAQRDPGLEGMATTVTMLLAHGRRGVIGHVGDSRAYLIRRDHDYQLTSDHELTGGVRNGGEGQVEIEAFSIDLEPGDTLVLCTDGAEDVVQEPEIVRVAGDLSPQLLASRIVSAANRRHPDQDATVVVVRVPGEGRLGFELSFEPHEASFGHRLAHVSRPER